MTRTGSPRALESLAFAAVMLSVMLSAGCATSPERSFLVGSWTAPSGANQKVTIRLHREMKGRGSLSTQLGPVGERFSGEYLRLDETVEDARLRRIHRMWVSDHFEQVPPSLPGQHPWGSSITLDGFRHHYDRHVVATLRGDRGHIMRCRLELLDSKRGLRAGARGECDLSTGDRILFDGRR